MRHQAMVVAPKPPDESAAPDSGGAAVLAGMAGSSAGFRWRGERMHYRCAGAGPSLILVHAPDIGACCTEWRRNIEQLSHSFTVFAVDLPGYGLSEIRPQQYTADLYIRFLADFARVVAEPPVRAVGVGLGASYLIHLAARYPSLVDRLLLVAPEGLTPRRRSFLASLQMLRIPGISAAVNATNNTRVAILEHLQANIYENEAHAGPLAVDTRYYVSHRPHAEHVEQSRAAGLQHVDARDESGGIRCPTALVWGRHCPKPPITDADAFLKRCPDAEIHVFDHSALAVHEEESHRFNQTALNFLCPEPDEASDR